MMGLLESVLHTLWHAVYDCNDVRLVRSMQTIDPDPNMMRPFPARPLLGT